MSRLPPFQADGEVADHLTDSFWAVRIRPVADRAEDLSQGRSMTQARQERRDSAEDGLSLAGARTRSRIFAIISSLAGRMRHGLSETRGVVLAQREDGISAAGLADDPLKQSLLSIEWGKTRALSLYRRLTPVVRRFVSTSQKTVGLFLAGYQKVAGQTFGPALPALVLLVLFGAGGNVFVQSLGQAAYRQIPPVTNQVMLRQRISDTLVQGHIISPAIGGGSDSGLAMADDLIMRSYPTPMTEADAGLDQVDRSGRGGAVVARPSQYVVQAGETISVLADRFDLSVETLKYANQLTNADQLGEGQKLKIPMRDYTSTELSRIKTDEQAKLAKLNQKKKTGSGGIVLASGVQTKIAAGDGWMLPIHYQYVSRGLQRGHQGVDYVASMGTPVYSSCSGHVARLGQFGAWNGGFGNLVVVDCGGGITMYYAHLSAYSAQAAAGGDMSEGDLIGKSGNSGNSTGPHLHFQVEKGGVPFDLGLR